MAATDPVQELLADVSAGRLPPANGAVEVHAQPPGRSAGVVAFTGHHLVAADVNADWVRDHLDDADIGAAMKPPFLNSLAELLRRPAGALDVVLVATGTAGRPPLDLVPLDEEHPRLTRAHRYRSGVRAYAVAAIAPAVVLVGRGFADRWETAFEVPPADRGRGLGRALADAARYLVPPGEPIWAQVSPGNAASLRAVLAAGYLPVGSEVLFAAEPVA
ncbi:MAG: hypothetical protein WKF47_06815 [Geodermatophilaceae bacterium]